MKKSILLSSLALLLLVGFQPASYVEATQDTIAQIPGYAKWGQLAMKRTKDKYPKAKIVDYQHLGKQEAPILTTEKFRFWLKEGDKEFGVNVTIHFYKESEAVKEVKLEEIKRKPKKHR